MKKERIIFGILFMTFFLSGVLALDQNDYCINDVVRDVSPTSIEVGEGFSVGIGIESCGFKEPTNVTISIIEVGQNFMVQEALSREIGTITYSNSQRFITYNFDTDSKITPGEYTFKYEISYGIEGGIRLRKEGSFSVRVLGSRAEMNIASIKTKPILPRVGETVEMTIRFENYGDGNANSIKVSAVHPFPGIKETFIGTLNSNEDSPAVFTFVADKSGEYNIPLVIEYKDDFGMQKWETKASVMILPKEQSGKEFIYAGIVAVIFIVLMMLLWRKGKKKDDVIRQLLAEQRKNKER